MWESNWGKRSSTEWDGTEALRMKTRKVYFDLDDFN